MKSKPLSLFGCGVTLMLLGASCSNDDFADNGSQSGGDLKDNYLSVNLVANHSSTRAGETPDNPGDGDFEDGSGNENTVKTVRLYFFNADGSAFVVGENENGQSLSYADVTSDFKEGAAEAPNVEKVLTATAKVRTNGSTYPTQVLAVLNPTGDFTNNTPSLSEINEFAANYSLSSNGLFTMSSSVYAEGTPAEVKETVTIGESDFKESAAEAEGAPVTIYVERVLAKVTLDTDLETPADENVAEGLYDTGKTININGTEQKVYVKFLGWNVTATADKSFLMKNINPGWAPTLFGVNGSTYEPWNYAPYCRSFWAINPSGLNFGYNSFGMTQNSAGTGYEEAGNALAANGIKGFGSDDEAPNYTYLQENAANANEAGQTNATNTGVGASHPSQVIVAAQLVNADGDPLPFAERALNYYSISDLQQVYANLISENHNIFYKVSENNYEPIDGSFITFKTAGEVDPGIMNWQDKGRYYVYATLNTTGETTEWYVKESNGNFQTLQNAKEIINNYLKEEGHSKVWNNGFTYWYFDIRHLASSGETGYYGVVRNHVYKATINSVAGFGTPVWNPGETIYPEQPENEESYIAATIKILSWRIVSQGVNFAW